MHHLYTFLLDNVRQDIDTGRFIHVAHVDQKTKRRLASDALDTVVQLSPKDTYLVIKYIVRRKHGMLWQVLREMKTIL
jgi:hypothetical protein